MATYTLVLDRGAVSTEYQLLGGGCEVCQTGNGQVFVVEVGVFAKQFVGLEGGLLASSWPPHSGCGACTRLLDYGQDPGLRIVVTVCTDAQIDLLWVCVAAEGGHQPEERVFWRLGNHVGAE